MTFRLNIDLAELRNRRDDLRAEAEALKARASLACWRLAVIIETAKRNVVRSRQSRTERRYQESAARRSPKKER
jgi:hypothetical protein